MFQRFRAWRNRRGAAKVARASAWRTAEDTGDDGLTNFQRLALPALEAVTGPLALNRAGTKELYLTGPILNTDLTLYLYADEVQVHGETRRFIAEKWDYDSPQALINELVSFVRTSLQSN